MIDALRNRYNRTFKNSDRLIENKVIASAVGGFVAGFSKADGDLGAKAIAGLIEGVSVGFFAWLTPNLRQ